MKKLNLGCGNDTRAGYINVDGTQHEGVDVVHDLNDQPYPFETDTFEEIIAYNIIEHLEDTDAVMQEIHRILKPGGVCHIKVPHYSSCFLWADPTHQRGFSYFTFDFWSDTYLTNDNWLASVRFDVKQKRIIWGANKLRKIDFISPLINLAPLYYERFFAYLVPSEEVWVSLAKPE